MKKLRFILVLPFILLFSLTIESNQSSGAEKYAVSIQVTSKDYGAKSGKDSTDAIQKALDDAAAKATSKKRSLVKIPKGTYYISRTLEIDSNIHLKLDNKAIIKKNNSKCLYMLRTVKLNKGKYTGVKNITIEGGIWDANFIPYNKDSGGTLMFFAHASDIEIKNATIKNNLGTHLIELAGVKDVTITGCKLYGFKYGHNGKDKEAIQLDIVHSDEITPDAAPYDDTTCKNILIKNNKIHDYPRGVGSHTSVKGLYHDNIDIIDNQIYDLLSEAIYAYNYINMSIIGNEIKNVGEGIVIKSFASKDTSTFVNRNKNVPEMKLSNREYGIRVENNNITTNLEKSGDGGSSFGIFIYGDKAYPINDVVIQNNKIKSGSSGIYLRHIGYSFIENNEIRRLLNAANTVKTSFAEDAIKLQYSPYNTIRNNQLSPNDSSSFENGIALRNNCTNTTIDKNAILTTNKSGIALYTGSSAAITANFIKSSGMHGITIVSGSRAVIDDNEIINSAGNGITVTKDSNAEILINNIKNSR